MIYAGGGANELMTGTRKWNTGIVARGRIYYPADNKIYAFKVPTTPTPSAARAAVADFNSDGHPDLVVQNAATHQTVIGYLNNNVVVSAAFGPTLPATQIMRSSPPAPIKRHFGICLGQRSSEAFMDRLFPVDGN